MDGLYEPYHFICPKIEKNTEEWSNFWLSENKFRMSGLVNRSLSSFLDNIKRGRHCRLSCSVIC